MKHGKKPTVKQATYIREQNLNVSDYLVVKDTPDILVIVKKGTRDQKTFYTNKQQII